MHPKYAEIQEEMIVAEHVTTGQMMGTQGMKANGYFFAYITADDELLVKLRGKAHQEAMALAGSKLFDPGGSGRPMKEWVVVAAQHADKWRDLAFDALEYIRELPPKAPKKKMK